MNIFVKYFLAVLQAGVVSYGMKVDDDLIYHGIESQPFPAYSSMYLPNFLSLLSLKNTFFSNRFYSNHSCLVLRLISAYFIVDYDPALSSLFFPVFV